MDIVVQNFVRTDRLFDCICKVLRLHIIAAGILQFKL